MATNTLYESRTLSVGGTNLHPRTESSSCSGVFGDIYGVHVPFKLHTVDKDGSYASVTFTGTQLYAATTIGNELSVCTAATSRTGIPHYYHFVCGYVDSPRRKAHQYTEEGVIMSPAQRISWWPTRRKRFSHTVGIGRHGTWVPARSPYRRRDFLTSISNY
eukprot:PhM_4_TR18875/c4_g4_i1/m.48176